MSRAAARHRFLVRLSLLKAAEAASAGLVLALASNSAAWRFAVSAKASAFGLPVWQAYALGAAWALGWYLYVAYLRHAAEAHDCRLHARLVRHEDGWYWYECPVCGSVLKEREDHGKRILD